MVVMLIVRRMRVEDVAAASKVSIEAMEDYWSRYAKDYYPRKALEFDKSSHTQENYTKRLQEENELLFVAEENGGIIGVATGRILRGYKKGGWSRPTWVDMRQTFMPRQRCRRSHP